MRWKVLVYRMWRKLYNLSISIHKEVFMFHNLDMIPLIPSPNIDIDISILPFEDISLLTNIWPVNIAQIQNRFKSRHSECYLSSYNGAPIAYHWVQFSGRHYIQQASIDFELEGQNIFVIYHVRVAEEYRNKGIGRFVYARIINDYKSKGYTKALIYTSARNKANIRALIKLGFRSKYEFSALRIGKNFYPLSSRKKLKECLK